MIFIILILIHVQIDFSSIFGSIPSNVLLGGFFSDQAMRCYK